MLELNHISKVKVLSFMSRAFQFLLDTDIRLVDGDDAYGGRIEVLYKGEWGTVCYNGFDWDDAHVAC